MGKLTMGGIFSKDCKFRLTAEQQKLVEDHLNVVRDAVRIDWWKWYMRGFHSKEDAFQTGVIRLMQCAAAWDEERARKAGGKTFRIYAWQYVRSYLAERGANGFAVRSPRDTPCVDRIATFFLDLQSAEVDRDSDSTALLPAVLIPLLYRNDVPSDDDAAEICGECLKCLTDLERQIVRARFGLDGRGGLAIRDIAQIVGRPLSTTQFYLRRALRKMGAVADQKYRQFKELHAAAA